MLYSCAVKGGDEDAYPSGEEGFTIANTLYAKALTKRCAGRYLASLISLPFLRTGSGITVARLLVILTRFPINSSRGVPGETNATKSRTDANVSTNESDIR
jgi:hypothetical protein